MKTIINAFLVFLFLVLYVICPGCKKVKLPSVETVQISDITENAAVINYKITEDGGGSISYHGVCWDLSTDPTTNLTTKTIEQGGPYGSSYGEYWASITGLEFGKTYHVRAYATNPAGTSYGKDLTFSTRTIGPPAGVKTKSVSALGSWAVISGGSFTSVGGSSEVECGLCWDLVQGPTTGSNKIFYNSSDVFSFTSIMTNLAPNTTYFARAYVSNPAGTVYGNEISVTTTSNVTDVENRTYHTVNIGTQVWLMENLATTKFNDGSPIPQITSQPTWDNLSTPAFCWFNNEKPLADDFRGALYNWHAVNTGKLCPAGFHVPTIDEWNAMTEYLGGSAAAAGEMLKPNEMQWGDVEYGVISDSCLFWGILCGTRDTIVGFQGLTGCGIYETSHYWSSTPEGTSQAWAFVLYMGSTDKHEFSRKNGYSVRCLKD